MVKKILSALITSAMVLSTMCFTAFADGMDNWSTVADTAWYNETDKTFTIDTAEELAGLAQLVNDGNDFAEKTITLDADINLEGKTWSGIGIYSKESKGTPFSGTFDGNDKTISNMMFDASGEIEYCGFFNQLYRATVKDLTIECDGFETGITGSYGGAVIAGHAISSTIEGCVSEGTLEGTHNVAGIVVRVQGSTIKNCINKAALTNSYSKLGGIVNLTQYSGVDLEHKVSVIEGCINEGAVTSTARGEDGVGGIIGYLGYSGNPTYDNDSAYRVEIGNCENKGTITGTGTAFVGQLVGKLHDTTVVYGTNKGLTSIVAVGNEGNGYGLDFAIVENDVATYTNKLEAGKTYLVTVKNITPVFKIPAGKSIAFDSSITSYIDTGITADTEINKSTVGNVTTYTTAPAPALSAVAQSGYYASEKDFTQAEMGDVAFRAFFENYADYDTVIKYGFYVFKTENGKPTIIDSSADLTDVNGYYTATITDVPVKTYVYAKPFAQFGENVHYGDMVNTSITELSKWLGAKEAE